MCLFQASTPGYFRAMGIPVLKGRRSPTTTRRPRHQSPWSTTPGPQAVSQRRPDRQAHRLRIPRGPFAGSAADLAGDCRCRASCAPLRPGGRTAARSGVHAVRAAAVLVPRAAADDGARSSARHSMSNVWQRPFAARSRRSIVRFRCLACRRWRRRGAIDRAVTPQRDAATLFGALALVLVTLGIYGVLSFLVGRRTREIGIRLALGATRADVTRLIVGYGMGLAAIGTAIGLAASWGITQSMRALAVRPFAARSGRPMPGSSPSSLRSR